MVTEEMIKITHAIRFHLYCAVSICDVVVEGYSEGILRIV